MLNLSAQLQPEQVFAGISAAAAHLNLETYVVGGFVRDLILKRPVKDIDFVCVGSGITLAEQYAEMNGLAGQVITFKTFGTAMLRQSEYELEFVGARRESYNRDSRKPIVEDGTLEEDQLRRDFTINAMAISLNKETYGQLVDPFNGQEDLVTKTIRTPQDAQLTFSDDPLRMMRAIRFASQLNFDIHPDTYEAIIANKQRLEIVSAERITEELNKIILSAKPSYGFKLLYHAGLLEMIFPEMIALLGAENVEGKTHKDNFYHTLEVLDNVAAKSTNLWLRWGAILHDIAKPATKRFEPGHGFTFHGHEEKGARMVPAIFRRMRLPMNEKMRMVQKLVRLHLRPIALVKDVVTDSAIRRIMVEAGEDLESLMILCRADVTTKNPNKAKRYLENFGKVEAKMAIVEAADSLRNFQPVLTGEHIIDALAITPGAAVGQIKEKVRQAILDGDVPNSLRPAFAYMLQVAQGHGYTAQVDVEAFLAAEEKSLAAKAAEKQQVEE